jgi:hypothetical protein
LVDMTGYVTQCVTSYQTGYVRDHLPCFLAVAWVKLNMMISTGTYIFR